MAKKKTNLPGNYLEQLFEDDTVATIDEVAAIQDNYRVYSSGCLFLDCATGKRDPIKGNGGFPQRTILENFGRNSSCKTATMESTAKQILQDEEDNHAIILYSEESDMSRWDKIGLTPSQRKRVIALSCFLGDEQQSLLTCERQLDKIRKAIQDPRVKFTGIDSMKGLALAKQIYEDNGTLRMLEQSERLGMRATMVGEFLRDFKILNKYSILYMTNQTADNPQLGPGSLYVNPQFTKQTPAGRAMEFECQLRIENETRPIYHDEEMELSGKKALKGWEVSYRLMKNKFSNDSGNRTAVANFYFDPEALDGVGFDNTNQILTLGEYLTRKGIIPGDEGVIRGGGGNWKIANQSVKGGDNALLLIKRDQELSNALERLIIKNSDWLFKPTKKTKETEENLEATF